MTRFEERENLITLLYITNIGGDYDRNKYDPLLLNRLDEVLQHIDTIDNLIVENLQNWTIDRLNYVDKAIIQYAIYELLYTNIPYEIVIDEAIELTKKFTNLDDDNQKAFNNKLLDTIKDSIKKKE